MFRTNQFAVKCSILLYSAFKNRKNTNYSMKVSKMNPWLRRALQVTLFEAIAIAVITTGALLLTDEKFFSSMAYAASTSVVAVIWNYIFNTGFEYWEAKQTVKGRSLLRRAVHAILFESGLIFTLVPLMAWWFKITLLTAFVAEIGLIIFFLVYSISFNWAFDKIVGLPQSAAPAP